MHGDHGEHRFELLDDRQGGPELLDVTLELGYKYRWVDVRPEVLVLPEADPAGDVDS